MNKELPVEYYELTDALVRKAKTTLSEHPETRSHKIKQLRSLLKEDDIRLPEDKAFLLQFLRARKFDVERAALLCKNFFRKQQSCRTLFSVDDLSFLQPLFDSNTVGCLPHRDSDGSVVLVFFAGRWDPDVVSIKQLAQFFMFGLIQLIRFPASQIAGCKCILDFDGLSMKHMRSISPRWVWHTLDAMQNCIPFSYKAFYILNENRFFPYVWSVFKLFLTKKLRDRFHFLGDDLEKLHAVFPPSTLPGEFGGDLGPLSSETLSNAMKDFPSYLKFLNQHGYQSL